ncbi:3-phenylpropionate-dihydrodiol/cinnamic acid-dihydrodiol dehydrogenase [Pseudomonas fluorescens]|uniref:3-phenylpropionate-dihydrodiol/cinnamic acid-dihydrodiol dehydrogenase n=2 Tax=Pseudomonas fluorescens TaxID=294 RepID=A0A5E7SDY5_PSEFL|nr:3-phenylpropionate-dihydrodiol/cinnamic acid-dihydrodiol dehydrogenase [Pseudomonas fluorescens]
MSKVWLITGSASGLGRHMAEAALEAGHCVLATARNTQGLADLLLKYPTRVRAVTLDVTQEAQGIAAVQTAVEVFGRIDVLVNNAGYGDGRAFEQVPTDEFRQVVETCLFGVVNLTRAVLPLMRRQRSGHIIQISSVGGRFAMAGNAAYFAAKWAVGGFTESIAQEVAPFGVKVTALEPGALRTNWGKRANAALPPVLSDYELSVGASIRQLEPYWGNESGDPAKVAQAVLRIAEATTLPPHILLGSDACALARQAEQARAAEADAWHGFSVSIDRDASGPVAAIPAVDGFEPVRTTLAVR